MGILFLTTCHEDKFYKIKRLTVARSFIINFVTEFTIIKVVATATKLKETWNYMQKEAQMDKLEEDWNGLMQLGYCGFWKPVRLTVFLKVVLVDC